MQKWKKTGEVYKKKRKCNTINKIKWKKKRKSYKLLKENKCARKISRSKIETKIFAKKDKMKGITGLDSITCRKAVRMTEEKSVETQEAHIKLTAIGGIVTDSEGMIDVWRQ